MFKGMTDEEHEYFHKLMYVLQVASEPKFTLGAIEHRGKGDLWDMPDIVLEACIQEEITDLMIYFAEKLRRQRGKA